MVVSGHVTLRSDDISGGRGDGERHAVVLQAGGDKLARPLFLRRR